MTSSSKRLLLILGSFTLAITTLFVYISFLVPSYNDVQALRGERASKFAIVKNSAEVEEKVNILLEKYKSLSEIEEIFSSILPSGPQIPNILNQLDGISRIDNVAIDSTSFNVLALKPSSRGIIKPIGTVRMSVALHGRYEDIKTFIKDIETNIRLMDVNSLRIEGGGVSAKDILNYNLEIDAYYQSDEKLK